MRLDPRFREDDGEEGVSSYNETINAINSNSSDQEIYAHTIKHANMHRGLACKRRDQLIS